MSVAAIFESIRREAEKAEDPGTMALFLARYYGFHPRITRMIQLVVGQQEGQDSCYHVCDGVLVNEEGNIYSDFWRALAHFYLAFAPIELTNKSQNDHFAAAEGSMWRVAIDRDGVDAAYIRRRIRVVKFDAAPMTDSGCENLRGLALEMIEAGDFETPSVVQRYLAETHPGDEYEEIGPGTFTFVTRCLGRVYGPDCYYSKVQLAALKEYVKKKFGILNE
ncbi:TPA: hypothetical protein DEP96_03720 [Candidatus Uhrbacteria bacterium]|nr:hypothetical protein [Candidatus Uhrbacteria bacterium]